MNKLYLYNTLTRKKEEFKPIEKGQVGLYTCGPTVYNYAHIGNLRTYIMADLLYRTLKFNGYEVEYVMNITDVEDKIIALQLERQEHLDRIQELRRQMIKECIHPKNLLAHRGTFISCKFCNANLSIPKEK